MIDLDYKTAFDQLLDIMSYAMRDFGYDTYRGWIEDCVSRHHHNELHKILEHLGYLDEE